MHAEYVGKKAICGSHFFSAPVVSLWAVDTDRATLVLPNLLHLILTSLSENKTAADESPICAPE